MSSTTIQDTCVELNAEGFFVYPEQWTEAMASELARRDGIHELTESHWTVIRFMRSEYFAKGTGPTVRMLGKASGVSIKELPVVPQWSGKSRRPHRRHPEASRLHLREPDFHHSASGRIRHD